MLEYDRIDISESIDINKCEETSRRCSLCKFYYGPFLLEIMIVLISRLLVKKMHII